MRAQHKKQALERFDVRLRLQIYREFVSRGRAPAATDLSRQLYCSPRTVRAGLERLAGNHVIALEAGAGEILRAAPFWATPTAFQVESGRKNWWASCIWDALGIPAMLGRDVRILTSCGCCGEALTPAVRGGKVQKIRAVIHFAVPARRWYEDLVFT
jgi:hypothetical protein